jgi:hypothetical protein
MIELIYIFVGFAASLIVVKIQLKAKGAGNCKMCKTCDYYLEHEEREREATNESA